MKQLFTSINKIVVCMLLLSLFSCSVTKQKYIERMKTPKQGIAILERYKHYSRSTWALYTLITDEGEIVKHISNHQLLDGPFSRNYRGCELVCWYDEEDPEEIYVCRDSMKVDSLPVLLLNAQLNHVRKVEGYARLTYQFVYDDYVFEWMEDIPLSEYERYNQLLVAHSPITIGLYRHPSKEEEGIPRVIR